MHAITPVLRDAFWDEDASLDWISCISDDKTALKTIEATCILIIIDLGMYLIRF
jgi:hypothetical protein